MYFMSDEITVMYHDIHVYYLRVWGSIIFERATLEHESSYSFCIRIYLSSFLTLLVRNEWKKKMTLQSVESSPPPRTTLTYFRRNTYRCRDIRVCVQRPAAAMRLPGRPTRAIRCPGPYLFGAPSSPVALRPAVRTHRWHLILRSRVVKLRGGIGDRVISVRLGKQKRGVGATGVARQMRRRDLHAVDGGADGGGGEPDALDWDLDLNLELELRDDQQSRLYRYLSEGHRPRYRHETPRRAATAMLANRSVDYQLEKKSTASDVLRSSWLMIFFYRISDCILMRREMAYLYRGVFKNIFRGDIDTFL